MTFLTTRDGRLVDGGAAPWPMPWGFRCDKCGRTLPYGYVLLGRERRRSRDQARETKTDVHVCGDCEGFVEQQDLWA